MFGSGFFRLVLVLLDFLFFPSFEVVFNFFSIFGFNEHGLLFSTLSSSMLFKSITTTVAQWF